MDYGKKPDSREKDNVPDWLRESEKYWDSYDKGETNGDLSPTKRREYLRSMKPEEQLDLHGMTAEEALRALDLFIREAYRRGVRKALIIHGKGNHSKEAPVLKREVTLFLEGCPMTGETGTPSKKWGGNGATWVLLKTGDEERGYRSR